MSDIPGVNFMLAKILSASRTHNQRKRSELQNEYETSLFKRMFGFVAMVKVPATYCAKTDIMSRKIVCPGFHGFWSEISLQKIIFLPFCSFFIALWSCSAHVCGEQRQSEISRRVYGFSPTRHDTERDVPDAREIAYFCSDSMDLFHFEMLGEVWLEKTENAIFSQFHEEYVHKIASSSLECLSRITTAGQNQSFHQFLCWEAAPKWLKSKIFNFPFEADATNFHEICTDGSATLENVNKSDPFEQQTWRGKFPTSFADLMISIGSVSHCQFRSEALANMKSTPDSWHCALHTAYVLLEWFLKYYLNMDLIHLYMLLWNLMFKCSRGRRLKNAVLVLTCRTLIHSLHYIKQ